MAKSFGFILHLIGRDTMNIPDRILGVLGSPGLTVFFNLAEEKARKCRILIQEFV